MSDIGGRIRTAREAKGFALRKAAPLLGISYVFLGAIERGEHRIPPKRLDAFARVLGIPISSLYEPDPATLDLVIAELVGIGGCDRAVRRIRELRGAS